MPTNYFLKRQPRRRFGKIIKTLAIHRTEMARDVALVCYCLSLRQAMVLHASCLGKRPSAWSHCYHLLVLSWHSAPPPLSSGSCLTLKVGWPPTYLVLSYQHCQLAVAGQDDPKPFQLWGLSAEQKYYPGGWGTSLVLHVLSLADCPVCILLNSRQRDKPILDS